MQIHELRSPVGSRKRRKIVGRGQGSGHGKTSCKGQKGQRVRSGRGPILGHEGGQMPLIKRLPKVGFNSKNPTLYQIVNLESLTRFKENSVIDADFLKSHGLISKTSEPFKVLGDGDLKKPLTVRADAFSKSAQEKIVKAGGKAEIVSEQKAQAEIKK
ncbi:MAG: 50S ribosomal protein L15 [Candidatus Omnitrophota bacterium]